MLLNWIKSLKRRPLAVLGSQLADQMLLGPACSVKPRSYHSGARIRFRSAQLLGRVRLMKPGLVGRARLANAFKFRLLERGIESQVADELTRTLLVELAEIPVQRVPVPSQAAAPTARRSTLRIQTLLDLATASASRGEHLKAIECCLAVLNRKPRNVPALNLLGVALCRSGRYQEALDKFRRATRIRSSDAGAYFNLGTLLRQTGQVNESESSLRRSVRLDPKQVQAIVSLGLTLILMDKPEQADSEFSKALRLAPRHAGAICGLGQLAALMGRFSEAETRFSQALALDPRMVSALAGLAYLRKMTKADLPWLRQADALAASLLAPVEEMTLRFAVGKYYDDTADFERAFVSYQRANQLQKTLALPYDASGHSKFVDDIVRTGREGVGAAVGNGCSDSARPVFVVGMMRSGTSLVEQIIASHPEAWGAGELPFWAHVAGKYRLGADLRSISPSARRKIAAEYLQLLKRHSMDAARVVDKCTYNANYLGLIHAVFPNARIIHVQRDPVDTCLSCYFTQFSPAHNFTMDLGDLAHYFGEHQRLMAHWQSVLPAEVMLNVPYEALIDRQQEWTARILEFLGLPWNDRCLGFHATDRRVSTASFWQVRQQLYRSSLARWRNYERFLGPLRQLQR